MVTGAATAVLATQEDISMPDNLALTGHLDSSRVSMQDFEIRRIAHQRGWRYDYARLMVMLAIFMVGHNRDAVNVQLDKMETETPRTLQRFRRR